MKGRNYNDDEEKYREEKKIDPIFQYMDYTTEDYLKNLTQ